MWIYNVTISMLNREFTIKGNLKESFDVGVFLVSLFVG